MSEVLWIFLRCKAVFKQKSKTEPRNCPWCKSQIIIEEDMDKRRKGP